MNKIYVVGIGPGAYEQMTVAAADILRKCEVIVGYTVYVDLLREHFTDKAFLTTASAGIKGMFHHCPALDCN